MVKPCWSKHPWAWFVCLQERLKFFFWLVLRAKINTSNLLRTKNTHLDSYDCVLCSKNCEETILHVLILNAISANATRTLNISWKLNLQHDANLPSARQQFTSMIFREMFIVVCRTIWCLSKQDYFSQWCGVTQWVEKKLQRTFPW